MYKALLASLILSAAAAAGYADDVRLQAQRIRTWQEEGAPVFLMEGAAAIESPQARIRAANIVAWLDTAESSKSGAIELLIYSETAGTGAVTTISGGTRLVMDDDILSAAGKPPDSSLLAQAIEARLDKERPNPADAPSDQRRSGRHVAGLPSGTGRTNPEPGPVTIRYSPIDTDRYMLEQLPGDDETVLVIRGGIEINFGEYSMRAQNIVMWIADEARDVEDAERIGDFQVYAEGGVSFRTPFARLDAERVFFDYGAQRAVLLRAEVYTHLDRGDIPLIMRADEVRVFSDTHFVASDAYVTTCEFGLPHYRIASDMVSLTATTDARGERSALLVARGNRFMLSDMPVLYLPNIARDLQQTDTPLRRFEVGSSTAFGTYVNTEWDLWDILSGGSADSVSARVSRWSDFTAMADYYGDRGPAGGLSFDYWREELAGEALGYYVRDRGTDTDDFEPPGRDRWRLRWRQRAFIDDLQIDVEYSQISDRGFLREYFEREAKEDKEPETYIYAKHPWESSQASVLYRARLNDFQTQTEYLGEARYDVVRFPLMDGRLLYASTSRAGNLRFRPDEDLQMRSYQTQRLDSLHAIEAPFHLGAGFNVSPFATARGSWYNEDTGGDEATRYATSWGAKLAFPPLWRTWDVDSRLLDIHRLRHIAALDVTYEDIFDTNKRPGELLQFDEVDAIGKHKAATVRLKQRLQTRRTSADPDLPDRVVDLASLEIEADFFPDARRDNLGENWSPLRLYGRKNITDDVLILTDGSYDTYSDRFDKAGIWLRADHSPRTTWGVGSRYLREVSSSTLTARLDHQITQLWEIMLFAQYDLRENHSLDETFVLRRNLHHFVLEIAVDYDRGRDDTTVGLRIYPAGLPGTRRSY